MDAAVAAAAVLAVVEPSMTGIGGDLFAIVYDARTKTRHGLNASGRSAYAATPEAFAARRLTKRQAIDLMMEEPNLIRRPLVFRGGGDAVFGFDAEEYDRLTKR